VDVPAIGRAVRELVEADHEEVVAAFLFGSTARGTRRAESDVDLGLLLAGEPPRTLATLELDLEGKLERRLGVPVQVVILNLAPPDLVHRVLRDGELLLDRDPSTRVRFEVRSRREYFDVRSRPPSTRPPTSSPTSGSVNRSATGICSRCWRVQDGSRRPLGHGWRRWPASATSSCTGTRSSI
jgi:hypothetical protein